MTVEAAATYLVELVGSVPGTRAAPPPRDGAGGLPFAVGYERSAQTLLDGAGLGHEIVTIYVEVHLSRVILPAVLEHTAAYRDALVTGIMADPTLGGAVSTVIGIRRTFGALRWGGMETIGYRFEVDVKVNV